MGLFLTLLGSALAQEVGWPTPPAGLQFPIPSEQSIQAPITESVNAPGAVVQVIQPSWPGQLPLIPPIAMTRLVFADDAWSALPLTLWVDAGTFAEVVQVRVTPVDSSTAQAVFGQLLQGFQIEFFDAQGRRLSAPPQRPIRVDVPAAALTASGVDGTRLLFWMQTEAGSNAMLTAFNTNTQIVTARLISSGMLILTDDS